VSDLRTRPLPKGRHSLTRQQVADVQRFRLAVAMAEAMQERGYVGTPVAEILKRAGVSRETFYQLYDDKLACFLDALDLVAAVLIEQMDSALTRRGAPDDALDRAERAIQRYLAAIGANPAFARLYLVEVHAAGPEALRRRADLQAFLADGFARLLGARTEAARFACQAFIGSIGSFVTIPIVTGDVEALRALGPPLVAHLRALVERGVIANG
jgi:AcrR family transcriptional regulator